MRRRLLTRVLGCGLSAVVYATFVAGAEQGKRTTATAAGNQMKKTVAAKKDSQHTKIIDEKLNQVLANQQLVLQKFEAIKEELRIIKIRAASRGAIQRQ